MPTALAITFGQVLDQTVGYVRDPDQLHDFRELPDPVFAGHAFEFGNEFQIFDDCHIQIKRRLFRQIADAALGCLRFIQYVVAVDGHRS